MKPPEADPASAAPADRLKSIDALRGFDMFWIVGGASVVHALDRVGGNAATGFLANQFTHVQWGGVHAYDVIYPLFLFLIGVSLVYSLDRLRGKETTGRVIRRILGRGALLYVLGVFYHGGLTSAWPAVRLSGVLPFIAVSYVGAALVYWFAGVRWRGLAVALALLLAGNWAIQTLAVFPDVRLEEKTVKALERQAGSTSPEAVLALVPGRISGVYEEGRSYGTYLDYRYLPGKKVNVYFESQGLLSPLGGVAICLLGALGGLLLKSKTMSPGRKSAWLLAGGAFALVLGCAWSLQFPIVKKLWTCGKRTRGAPRSSGSA
ncbi:MAG TPA: heparan-alpha-glucosaminide N-acetyltransferase domain-containing protein [Lacunisphaera sp.]|nr:heparan-alpha-glucosaminide N-acetyltransferase domain-containing protein [Lacunisphaera sp.]